MTATVPLRFTAGESQHNEAVQTVNTYEPYFKSNLAAYQAGQQSSTQCDQVYDALWASMAQVLGQLGSEGSKALADRSPGGKYPWQTYYRPTNTPTSVSTTGLPQTQVSGQTISNVSGIPITTITTTPTVTNNSTQPTTLILILLVLLGVFLLRRYSQK